MNDPSFWAQIQVVTHTEAVEAATFHLTELGAVGVASHQECDDIGGSRVTITAYFPMGDDVGDLVVRVRDLVNSLGDHGLRTDPGWVSLKPLRIENWATAWRSHFKPHRFGERLIVAPTWQELGDVGGAAVVRLDPGMAFGTGAHASTRLVLDQMTGIDLSGKRVLDVGTGSGILAIAAIKLGAASALAVDNDPDVLPVAVDNCRTNGVQDVVEIRQGKISDVSGDFDLVLMNILADVIVPALGDVARVLRAGGTCHLSGITLPEGDKVRDALPNHCLRIVEQRENEGWVAISATLAARS